MKSLTSLVRFILEDIEYGCGTSTTQDGKTILRRVKDEGLSFLTITLPNFCKDFESCLDRGLVDSSNFLGFRRQKLGVLPLFLGGLLSQVFNSKTGVLLDEPNMCCIKDIRQLCLMFKKIQLPCTERRTRAAYTRFIECEHELKSARRSLESELLSEFTKFSRIIWSDSSLDDGLWTTLERKLSNHDVLPKHGPGATAERISGNRKYDLRRWHSRLEPFFPFDLFGSSRPDMEYVEDGSLEFVDPGAEQPVRVISVPKTLKTPRIIAIEPVCMQYTQQALLEQLVPLIEHHPLSKGSVNFTSQDSNKTMARTSSKNQKYSTLDLSEASDRVMSVLVRLMLAHLPNLSEAVFACRSTRADVPGIGVIPLTKFASMGSALCFPIESMVFYTILMMAQHRALHIRPTYSSIRRLKVGVRVYGDDLIVPVDIVPLAIDLLQDFGLKVNRHKSFWTGKFRESCGCDAYDEVDVTPTYIRQMTPHSKQDVEQIVSWVSLSNLLFRAGYWRASEHCKSVVEAVLKQPLRLTRIRSATLGLHDPFRGRVDTDSWHKDLHVNTIATFIVKESLPSSILDGEGALMKYFLKRDEDPYEDLLHLLRAGRPRSARIITRKVPS